MKKFKKIIVKIITAVGILFLDLLAVLNGVYATQINSANLYSVGDCGQLLTYKGVTVLTYYVEYNNNGNTYPAYCLDKTKAGVKDGYGYSVLVNEKLKDVELWKRVINGYPYKSCEELGVANKMEAFTATKQAIYCYIHGNNVEDYGAIGEAGQRTLNALKNIVNNANNCNQTQISNKINIKSVEEEWEQDELDKQYVYKKFYVEADSAVNKYEINLEMLNEKEQEGIRLVNEKNIEQKEFNANEKFKILIPIKIMNKKGNFKINIKAKLNTKPVLYGIAPDNNYQDYALTGQMYEDSIRMKEEEYLKNETKIIIKKQDEITKEGLEAVEFELLDENKQVIYSGLKTNKEGTIIIDNIIPGDYYLKETKTIEGYETKDELINIQMNFGEEINVIVTNKKEEKPKIEKEEKKEIKRLPKTGM